MDLSPVQFPRYLHHPVLGAKRFETKQDGQIAMDAGWVLSPNDFPRLAPSEWREMVPEDTPVAPPLVPRKRGRPKKKLKESAHE